MSPSQMESHKTRPNEGIILVSSVITDDIALRASTQSFPYETRGQKELSGMPLTQHSHHHHHKRLSHLGLLKCLPRFLGALALELLVCTSISYFHDSLL